MCVLGTVQMFSMYLRRVGHVSTLFVQLYFGDGSVVMWINEEKKLKKQKIEFLSEIIGNYWKNSKFESKSSEISKNPKIISPVARTAIPSTANSKHCWYRITSRQSLVRSLNPIQNPIQFNPIKFDPMEWNGMACVYEEVCTHERARERERIWSNGCTRQERRKKKMLRRTKHNNMAADLSSFVRFAFVVCCVFFSAHALVRLSESVGSIHTQT